MMRAALVVIELHGKPGLSRARAPIQGYVSPRLSAVPPHGERVQE